MTSSFERIYVISGDDRHDVNIISTSIGVFIDLRKRLHNVECIEEGLYVCGIAAGNMNISENVKQEEFSIIVDGNLAKIDFYFIELCQW